VGLQQDTSHAENSHPALGKPVAKYRVHQPKPVAGARLADSPPRLPAGAGQAGRQGVPGRVASLLYEGGVAPGRQLPVTSAPQPLCALCRILPVSVRPAGSCRAWLNLEAPAKTLRRANGSATSSPDELFGKDRGIVTAVRLGSALARACAREVTAMPERDYGEEELRVMEGVLRSRRLSVLAGGQARTSEPVQAEASLGACGRSVERSLERLMTQDDVE